MCNDYELTDLHLVPMKETFLVGIQGQGAGEGWFIDGDLNCGALQRASISQHGDDISVRAVENEWTRTPGPHLTWPERCCTDSKRSGVDITLSCPWLLNKSGITHGFRPTRRNANIHFWRSVYLITSSILVNPDSSSIWGKGTTGLHLLLLPFQPIDLHFNIFLQAILNLFSHL